MNTTVLSLEILSNKQDFQKQLELCNGLISKTTWVLFAVGCYRDTLNWIKNPDPRSVAAVDAAEAFVLGKATLEELSAAESASSSAEFAARSVDSAAWSSARSADFAAWSAARSTESAEFAARSAARSTESVAESSARSATRNRQKQILIKLIKEELCSSEK